MALGIEKTLEVIEDLKNIAKNGKDLVTGNIFEKAAAVGKIIGNVTELAKDAKDALPEVKDLTAEEVGKIGASSYEAVRYILGLFAA